MAVRRVFMTADAVGGVWTYAVALGRALVEAGAAVALATLGPRPSDGQRADAEAAGLALRCGDWPLEWQRAWKGPDQAAGWLLEEAARFGADLVHLNGYAHAVLPWSVPVVVVGHSCVLSWYEAVRGVPAPSEWRRYREDVGRGLAAAHHVVAPSHAMLVALSRHYGPQPRASVVPNGLHAETRPAVRREPIVLAAGRVWDEAKDFATLDAAAARISWPVFVAGDVRGDDGTRAALAHACALGRLPRPVLAARFGRAALFAHPAVYEPFGLAVLEAASGGCALVLSDLESLRETWDGCAAFVPPRDPAALADAVNVLAQDPVRRAALATRGHDRARTLTPQRMCRAYGAVYEAAYRAWMAATEDVGADWRPLENVR